MASLSEQIKARARDLGFSMAGIAPAHPSSQLDAYLRWVEAGMHGTMGYLARPDRIARRREPGLILTGARSLVVVGLDYYTVTLPDAVARNPARGRFSNYAWAVDYHDLMLERLEALASFLRHKAGTAVAARAYVDTGAILERSHAAQAGLGFTGKNTMLIHPRRGSYFFLGEIITDLALDYDEVDERAAPGCGTCTRCLAACPTDAFPRPYVLDARRCISYLTIEHEGFIPTALRLLMGNWVYGCDVCQEVCPWQRFSRPTPFYEAFSPIDLDRAAPPLTDLLTLTDQSFAVRFDGTAVKRTGRARLVRNACIAAGNSGQPGQAHRLAPLLNDDSSLVRGHAAWALGRLGLEHDALRAALTREIDAEARAEIEAALAASGG
jgi:epoxyqueuosine reductase